MSEAGKPAASKLEQGARAGVRTPVDIEFLERTLSSAEPGEIVIANVPAPGAAADRLSAFGPGPAAHWTPPDGRAYAGLGSAHTIRADGPTRFEQVRAAADELWRRVRTVDHPDCTAALGPRLIGGFSFLAGQHPPAWAPYGDAVFLLPRLSVTADSGRPTLSVALDAAGRSTSELAREIEAVLDHLASSDPGPAPDPVPPTDTLPDDRERWSESVRSIQRRIAQGHAKKIVAARCRSFEVPSGPVTRDPGPVLRRLDLEPTATRFAFRMEGRLFVGATPERLVSRRGTGVRTEALAGTVAAGEEARLRPLLESVKESAEHEFVVRAIAGSLEPFCEVLSYPEEPAVQKLRHVHHLRTPFRGRLSGPAHVLELVERLHPTPAVGGWPTEEALRWIEEHEPGGRGWYAAPIGWFDASGDGEFVVALRSGLFHDDRVHLYAGAGIVADSDAAAEFRETEVKLRTMKEALGLAR